MGKEASGILNQFIAGFKRLKERGKFLEPSDCIRANQEFLSKSNLLPAFIKQCCEEEKSFRQPLGDFYREFCNYCRDNGSNSIYTQQSVGHKLESLGYDVYEKGHKKHVRGIRALTNLF